MQFKVPHWLNHYMPLLKVFYSWLFPKSRQDTHLVEDYNGNYHAKPIDNKWIRIRQLFAWTFLICLCLFIVKLLIPVLIGIILILIIIRLIKK